MMDKRLTNKIILGLFVLAAAAVLGGGLYLIAYTTSHPLTVKVLRRVSVKPPADPESIFDENVTNSGRAYVEKQDKDGKIDYEYKGKFVSYRTAEGLYKDIDTTVVQTEDKKSYENTTNVSESRFAVNSGTDSLVSFNVTGDRGLDFGFVDAKSVNATVSKNSVTYAGIIPGFDAKYTVTGGQVLEELIARNKVEVERISQKLNLKNVYYKAQTDRSIKFFDKNTHNQVFTVPKPVMYEQKKPENKNYGIYYEIKQDGDTYLIDKVLDMDGVYWLKSAEYPVVIDLSVGIPPPSLTIWPSTTLSSGNPQITTIWNTVDGATNYFVQYSTDNATWSDACTIPAGNHVRTNCSSGFGSHIVAAGLVQFDHTAALPGQRAYYRLAVAGTLSFGNISNGQLSIPGMTPYDFHIDNTESGSCAPYGCMYIFGALGGNSVIQKRLLSDGSLVTSFGTGGTAVTTGVTMWNGDYPNGMDIDANNIYIAAGQQSPCSGENQRPHAAAYNRLTGVTVWDRCYTIAQMTGLSNAGEIYDVKTDGTGLYFTGWGGHLSSPLAFSGRLNPTNGNVVWKTNISSGYTPTSTRVAIDNNPTTGRMYIWGNNNYYSDTVIFSVLKSNGSGLTTASFPNGHVLSTYGRIFYDPTTTYLYVGNVYQATGGQTSNPSDAQYAIYDTVPTLSLRQAWRDSSNYPDKEAGGIMPQWGAVANRTVTLFSSTGYVSQGQASDWHYRPAFATDLNGSLGLIFTSTTGKRAVGLMIDTNNEYMYGFGTNDSNEAYIEKRKYFDKSLGNAPCDTGQSEYPACLQWGGIASPAYRNVRTTAVATAPTVTALSWNRLRVNVASTFLPSSGTTPRPNPTSVELCLGISYTDWPNQGVPSGSAGTRYFGNLYSISPTYMFYLTPRDSYDSSATPPAEVIENNTSFDYYRPKCMAAGNWSSSFPTMETNQSGSGAMPYLFPNRAYSVGLYARQADDAVDSSGGRVTEPSATTTVYTYPRQVIAPTLEAVAGQSQQIKMTIPDGTINTSIIDDATIPGDDRSYTNPAATEYSVKITNGISTYYGTPGSMSPLNGVSEQWGNYTAWGGAAGVINTALPAGSCWTATVRSRSTGTPRVNAVDSAASTQVCTPLSPPSMSGVACYYSTGSGYYCTVSVSDGRTGLNYKLERQSCHGATCTGWSTVTCRSMFSGYTDSALTCSAVANATTYNYRVSAFAGSDTTCTLSQPATSGTGTSTLPPCQPGQPSMTAKTNNTITWDWTPSDYGDNCLTGSTLTLQAPQSGSQNSATLDYCGTPPPPQIYSSLTPNTQYQVRAKMWDDYTTNNMLMVRSGQDSLASAAVYTYAANPTITVSCTDTICTITLANLRSNPAGTQYLIQRCSAGASCPTSATDDTNWTNIDGDWQNYLLNKVWTDNGRTCGTEYRYRLKARNVPLEITPSTPVVLRQTAPCVPTLGNSAPSFNISNVPCINWVTTPGAGIAPLTYNYYNSVDGTGTPRVTGGGATNQHCDAGWTIPNQRVAQSVRGRNVDLVTGPFSLHYAFTAANLISVSGVTCGLGATNQCTVNLNTNGNPAAAPSDTKYRLERRYCNNSTCTTPGAWTPVFGTGASAWRVVEGQYIDNTVGCTNAYVQYRVRVKNNDNEIDPTDTESLGGYFFTKDAADGYSQAFPATAVALPPCPPSWGTYSHNNQSTTSINWIWNASSTSGVTNYKTYNASGSPLACGTTALTTLNASSSCIGVNCSWNDVGLGTNTQFCRCVSALVGTAESAKTAPACAFSGIEPVDGTTRNISFPSVNTTSIGVTVSPAPSNLSGALSGSSGVQFREIGTNWGAGTWTKTIPATHSPLQVNTQYCYKAQTRNGDASTIDGTGDYTTEGPVAAQCKYTLANVPSRPIVQSLPGGEINVKVQENGNPANTNFAICITKYKADGTIDDTGYLNTDDDFNGRVTVDWALNCNLTPDTVGHWAVKGTTVGTGWSGDNGITATGLDPSVRYEFKVKAQNQESVPTTFGPVATLFLIKNNIVGWAWTTSAGWISLNYLNFFANPPADYSGDTALSWGVNSNFEASREINPLEGYAWSSSGQSVSQSNVSEDKTLNVTGGSGLLAFEYSFKQIAYDGQYLWAAPHLVNSALGQRPSLLYRINPSTFVTEKFNYSGAYPNEDFMRLVYDGTDLWATGQAACRLYRFATVNDPARYGGITVGQLIETVNYGDASCATPDSGQSGLVWDGKDFWIASRNGVVRIRRSLNLGETKEINCNGTSPSPTPVRCSAYGINTPQQPYFDGQSIWVNNFNGASVSRLNRTDGIDPANQVKTFSLPSGTDRYPREIVFDGNYWWVSHGDTGTRGLVSVLKINNDVGTWVKSDFELQATGGVIMGLEYDTKNVWAAGYDGGKVYRIRASTILNSAPEVQAFPTSSQPFKLTYAIGSIWTGLHSLYSTNLYIPKFSVSTTTPKTGLGWISMNAKVCADDSQRGCYRNEDCVSNSCIESAGTPVGSPLYGFCYNAQDGTGKKYGTCSTDVSKICWDKDLSNCPSPSTATCIFYSCKTGDTCPVDASTPATEECRATATANFNGTTRGIEGWARILTLKKAGTDQGYTDWGWMKLAGTYNDGRGNAGPYQLSGTEIDSQSFLADPNVNPNDTKLYSVFGWGWNAQTSAFTSKSSWLNPENATQDGWVKDYSKWPQSSMVLDGHGSPHLAWSAFNKTNNSFDIYYLQLLAGKWATVTGVTYDPAWTDAEKISNRLNVSNNSNPDTGIDPNGDGSVSPSLALDSDGNPHIVWQEGGWANEYGKIVYSRWDASAGTWTAQQEVSTNPAQTPTLKIDSTGTLNVVFRHGPWSGATTGIYFKQLVSGSWQPMNNDANNLDVSKTVNNFSSFPRLAMDGTTPMVTWQQQVPAGTPGLNTGNHIFYRYWNGTNWVTASNDGTSGFGGANLSLNNDVGSIAGLGIPTPDGVYPDVAVDSNHVPGIVWRDPNKLLYRRWNGSAWVSVSGQADITNLQVNKNIDHAYDYSQSVVFDTNNIPHIAWSDYNDDDGSGILQPDILMAQWSGSAWVTAGGNTFNVSQTINTPNLNLSKTTTGRSNNPLIKLDRFGNPHVIWNEKYFSALYCGAFNDNGIVDGPQGMATQVAIDSTNQYLYAIGSYGNTKDADPANDGWRIEKRRLDNGQVCTAARCSTTFGTNGVITGGSATKDATDIVIDSNGTYMYVVGTLDNVSQWRIEKRRLDTGALVNSFDGDGVIEPARYAYYGLYITQDAKYIYVAAKGGVSNWQIAKYLKANGNLYTTNTTGGWQSGLIDEVLPVCGIPGCDNAIFSITADGTYMYIAGSNANTSGSGPDKWRIEKRRLDNGTLEPAFGTGGAVTGPANSYFASDIILDGQSLYVGGNIFSGTLNLLIGKYDKVTGSPDAGFGTGGFIQYSSTSSDSAVALSVDGTYLYAGGAPRWHYQKWDKNSGTPFSTATTNGWGYSQPGNVVLSNGAMELNNPSGDYGINGFAIDGTYMYAVGNIPEMSLTSTANWHIEKRLMDTGVLKNYHSSNECTDTVYPQCLDYGWDTFELYYCGKNNIDYSLWSPGIAQGGNGWVEFMPAGALLGIPWVKTMFADIHASQNISLAPPPRGTGDYTSTYLIESGGAISGISGYYGGTTTGSPTSQLPEQPGFSPLVQNQPSIQTLGADLLAKLDVNGLVGRTNGSKNRHGTTVVEGVGTDISTSGAFTWTGLPARNTVLGNKVYYFHGQPTYTINSDMTFLQGDDSTNPATSGAGVIVVDGNLEINANIYYDKRCSDNSVCRVDADCGSGTCDDPHITNLVELPSAAIIVRGNVYINSLISKVSSVVAAIDNPSTADDPTTTTVVENLEGIISTGRKAPSYSYTESVDDTFVSYDGSTYLNAYQDVASSFGRPGASTTNRSFLRFPLGVPAGAEIKSAYLRLRSNGSGIGDFNARLYLIDGENASTLNFTSSPNPTLYNIATSNSVNFLINSNWVSGTWYQTPDLKAIIQRFVSKDNYSAGNYLGLVIKEGDAATGESRGFQTYDSAATNAPQLVIEYSPRRATYPTTPPPIGSTVTSTTTDSSTQNLLFGWNGTTAQRAYLQFPISIPINAEILKAQVHTTMCAAGTTAMELRQGLLQNYPTAAQITATAGAPWALPLTAEVSEVAQNVSLNAFGNNQQVAFSDITRQINAFIARTTYRPGVAGISEFDLRIRRGSDTTELIAAAGETRCLQKNSTTLAIDYQIPLSVSGLFVAGTGYNFDRKYMKNLDPAEQILYDGRVVANTPPGLVDFIQALPVYHRVTP